jgi:hypothetical protein
MNDAQKEAIRLLLESKQLVLELRLAVDLLELIGDRMAVEVLKNATSATATDVEREYCQALVDEWNTEVERLYI